MKGLKCETDVSFGLANYAPVSKRLAALGNI